MKPGYGMMWLVHDKLFYDETVKGIEYYKNKYGADPTWLHVKTAEQADILKEFYGKLDVVVDPTMLKHNVWMGEEE